jgi:hypothetical protein
MPHGTNEVSGPSTGLRKLSTPAPPPVPHDGQHSALRPAPHARTEQVTTSNRTAEILSRISRRRLAAARVTGYAGPAASLPLPPARSRSAGIGYPAPHSSTAASDPTSATNSPARRTTRRTRGLRPDPDTAQRSGKVRTRAAKSRADASREVPYPYRCVVAAGDDYRAAVELRGRD